MVSFASSIRSRFLLWYQSINSVRGRAWCASCATACVSIALIAGCGPATQDVFTNVNPLQPELLDDTAPPPTEYDETLSFVGRYGVEENHSVERFRFDVAAYKSVAEQQQAEQLHASHAAFIAAHSGAVIPSVQTIGTYLKQLDDTIYAGVERAVQVGLEPALLPKQTVLTGALEYLTAHRSTAADDAIVHLAAALRMGGTDPSVPADLVAQVDDLEDEFSASEIESKPIGFYTWSAQLRQIWRQDRLLQRELSAVTSCALAAAISADSERRTQYEQLVELYSRLTNPLRASLVSMLDVADDPSCTTLGAQSFLSASSTPEVALFEQLYPLGVPASADLMSDLIKAIREGTVDLAPQTDDGWYQHQLYALETLLVTDKSEERAKVAFMARYKKRLQEAFKTMLVQHRETHVKQADTVAPVSLAPPPTPHFRLEPLATVYVRHARSYVFLEVVLDTVMGAGFLDLAVGVDEDGLQSNTLRERIHQARDLFFGLYILSCQDIGLSFKLDAIGDPAPETYDALATAADAWLVDLANDSIAASDVRVMVPIAGLPANRTKYWAVIGVRATIAGYSYIDGSDVSPPSPEDQARVWLPTEQFLEVESSGTPLTRDEFRALCDQHQTAAAIQGALEAR